MGAGMPAGSYFVLSMLDRLWHPDLTLEEAQELMEKGIEEVRSLCFAETAQCCYMQCSLVSRCT